MTVDQPYVSFLRERNLSCFRELNSGPHPYQGCALPLSYISNSIGQSSPHLTEKTLGRTDLCVPVIQGYKFLSGKRDSNPRPPAWKASALSTELFPQERSFLTAKRLRQSPRTAKLSCGCGWIRTTEVERQQIYSLPHLATLEHTQF